MHSASGASAHSLIRWPHAPLPVTKPLFPIGVGPGFSKGGGAVQPYPDPAPCLAGGTLRDALEGEGPQGRPQRRLDRRLEEVAEAVGGGYCRLQMSLSLALGVRGTVAGRRLGALTHTETANPQTRPRHGQLCQRPRPHTKRGIGTHTHAALPTRRPAHRGPSQLQPEPAPPPPV